jgi:hypothetical protein
VIALSHEPKKYTPDIQGQLDMANAGAPGFGFDHGWGDEGKPRSTDPPKHRQ